MADRIFGTIALVIIIAYGWIAFTIIKAPFQYDPLGPESWPRILAIVAGLCCLYILVRPDTEKFAVAMPTWGLIGFMVVALIVYAAMFEPLGFMLATALYCGACTRVLGASTLPAALFGIATGVIGYFVCVYILALNLPAGLLSYIL